MILTKREYIATKIAAGIVARPAHERMLLKLPHESDAKKAVCRLSIEYTDLLIKELKSGTTKKKQSK